MFEELKDKLTVLAIWILAGLVISFAIVLSLSEISWLLFDPTGQYFNSDTLPLFIQLKILVDSIFNPFTYLLTPVGMFIAYIIFKIYE